MRVMYFVSLFPCWSETFIVREVKALIDFGVDVRIISLKPPSESVVHEDARALLERIIYPVSWQVAFLRVASQLLRHPVRELHTLAGIAAQFVLHPAELGKSLIVWWRTVALLPEIRSTRPEHLHAHFATYPSTAAMFASKRLGIPFSFTAHAHDIFLEDHFLAKKMRDAAFGVTISEFNRQYMTEISPLAKTAISIIHCGVSAQDFLFKPDRLRSGPSLLLAVGRLDEIKGFVHLIDACKVLVSRGLDFECLIIGEGPLRFALQARIDNGELTQRVRLVGALSQDEVRHFLSTAQVFVLPSVVTSRGNRDGIPVSLMEAMAVGLPVVSTYVSGIPELISDGVNGFLVPPEQPEALACAIERVLIHSVEAAILVHRARETVESEFEVTTEARKLYKKILEVGQTPRAKELRPLRA